MEGRWKILCKLCTLYTQFKVYAHTHLYIKIVTRKLVEQSSSFFQRVNKIGRMKCEWKCCKEVAYENC